MAGLCCGIYARKAGFEVEIYEKNACPGGNCSSWKKGEYYVDNCVHWLLGTHDGTPQNQIWREVGALGDDVNIIKRDEFYSSELDGKKITFWRDIDRTERELLELSPEDEKEIRRFFAYVRVGETLQEPGDFGEMAKLLKDLQLDISKFDVILTMLKYLGLNFEELAQRFKHPLLKRLILDFMAKEYEAYWIVLAYSFFVKENADIPEGGSKGMVERIVAKYKQLGGKLFLRCPVEQIKVERIHSSKTIPVITNVAEAISYKHRAEGIVLADGRFIEADYVVCACDINFVFNKLLRKRFAPKQIKKFMTGKNKKQVYSSFQVAFAVEGLFEEIPDTLSFDCDALDVGKQIITRITVKNYRMYGDYIAPPGRTVIQCSVVQYPEDFKFWTELSGNYRRYKSTKLNTANAIRERIYDKFPEYENKIHILDIWTPNTYAKRNNCFEGAYMRFITTFTSKSAFIQQNIKGIGNVLLAGQWLKYPGGLPMAAYSGKVAAETINKLETGKKHIIDDEDEDS